LIVELLLRTYKLMINFFSVAVFCGVFTLGNCSVGHWSAGTKIIVDSSNLGSTFVPLSIEGRGSMKLVSGSVTDPYTPVVSFYQSELVAGVTVWSQQAALFPADSATTGTFSGFGSSFDLDQDIILVGSSQYVEGSNGGPGSAYVFQGSWTKWSQQQKLLASDSNADARGFGYSVGLYENFALITAPDDDDKGTTAGSVYAFVSDKTQRRLDSSDVSMGYTYSSRGSWSQLQKIYPKDILPADKFGFKVVISEGTAVVGSYNAETAGYGRDAAYIFTVSEETGTWSYQQRLSPSASSSVSSAGIGNNIAFYDKTIVLGSTNDNVGIGSAYVYRYTSSHSKYSLTQTLTPPVADGSELYYGTGISLYDKSLMIGAIGYDNFKGATYSYYYNGHSFSQQQRLLGPSNFVNPYIYGMSAFVTQTELSGVASSQYLTADFNWSCVVVSLGDQFGDGWDTAKLVITAPDGTSDVYAPYCDSRNPFQFRYCPTLPSDSGVYSFSIPKAPESKYFWEIYWTVTEESTGKTYRGDHATQLSFDFDQSTTAFSLTSAKHVVTNNQTCKVCPPKPKPPPKAVPPSIVVTPGNAEKLVSAPAKTAPFTTKTAPAYIAAPKVFRSRKLLDTSSPSGQPSSQPTGYPTSIPTPYPSIVPTATPSGQPTVRPTTLAYRAGKVVFPWFKLYDNAADGWFEADGTGTSYYISDANGDKLISTGTLCGDLLSAECWQVIPDGTFILRVGGGLDADSGDHTWDFCGKTGGSQRQLLFTVSQGECTPLQVLSRSEICSTAIEPRMKLLGELLLTGLDSQLELTSEDSLLVSKVMSSLGTVLKATEVTITGVSYSSSLEGHVLSFSCYVMGDAQGYDYRDYTQVEATRDEISSELSSAISNGQFLSSVVSSADVSTADSNSLKYTTGVSIISLSIYEVDFVEKHSMQVDNTNVQQAADKTDYPSETFMESDAGLYSMFGVAAGLVLAVGLAVFGLTKFNGYHRQFTRLPERLMDESAAAQLLEKQVVKQLPVAASPPSSPLPTTASSPSVDPVVSASASPRDSDLEMVEQEQAQWVDEDKLEGSEDSTGSYSSGLFLVGKPVKGEMTFNNTSLSQDDQPLDLWLGMKKFVNDEDALLNNFSGRR